MSTRTHKNRYDGPWRDNARSAIAAGGVDVGLSEDEYEAILYADGWAMEPHDPEKLRINVEIVWSDARQQYRAILRREVTDQTEEEPWPTAANPK